MKLKYGFLLLFIVAALTFAGCTSGGEGNSFYLAGTINISSPVKETVYMAFYKNNCTITYDPDGNVSDIKSFSSVGNLISYNVFGSTSFQIIIPEPYDSVGGVLAWIDTDGNKTPDPLTETVRLAAKIIDGANSIIAGMQYDSANKNFLITYENSNGSFQQYLSIIGNNNYLFEF